jgi:2-polyprenyl-3-methyl-5-hydroxy-6-metoxy-1,4-benzoquinol methylase
MSESKLFYEKQRIDYYSNPRKDILPLLPENILKVLEIGCGQGATLQWIQTIRDCVKVVGVELFPEAAEIAKKRLDSVIQGNIESIELPFENNEFDLILCLDVLEHLIDPWDVLKKLATLLKLGGSLITSIPNVKHYKVILPLLFLGRWDYVDSGILDKTHLRFFTRKTAIGLIESSGLKVDKMYTLGPEKHSKSWTANILSIGILKVIFESHYIIRAIKV